MALFDALINDMASRFGLGANAAPLVREALALISGSQGGVAGFLNLFKTAGLSSQVASWMGQANAAPIAAPEIERIVGASALGGIAKRLGLGQTAVSTALAYGVPKLIGLLTPNGDDSDGAAGGGDNFPYRHGPGRPEQYSCPPHARQTRAGRAEPHRRLRRR